MFGFKKKLQTPFQSTVEQAVDFVIKSYSLPEMTPKWNLFAKSDRDWCTKTAIREGYAASAVVYAAIEKRAKAIASVPWVVMRNGEPAPDSELQKLINSPNPDQSWYEVVYTLEQNLCLSGNGFMSEVRAGNQRRPTELWTLPSQYVKIKPGREKLIAAYEYDEGASKFTIPSDDMIQLRLPNPASRYFGMPPLKAAGRAADVDRESGDWQKASLQNRGLADLHIKLPDGVTPEQQAAAMDAWNKRQSSPANARKPIITTADVKNLGMNATEMDFIASRKAVWSEIAAAFGVPLAMLGFTENVNLANADAMKRAFYEDTIIPELELIKRQLNQQLASEFGAGFTLEYDTSNVKALQDDYSGKLDQAKKLIELGYTRNEVNRKLELGFDDTDGGDIRYEPMSLIPLGANTIAEPDTMTEEEKALASKLGYGE